ncbi:MAG: hypothetical protein J2P48_02995 [Alphaproteobacteria bacterium]|nr:hypothetical protein [Alphaproteobacteria bacterium]
MSDNQGPHTARPGTGRVVRRFPPGDALPGCPTAVKSRGKTPRSGRGRRGRWKTPDGTIFEYGPSGRRHLGDCDPWDGRQVGAADPTRQVEP